MRILKETQFNRYMWALSLTMPICSSYTWRTGTWPRGEVDLLDGAKPVCYLPPACPPPTRAPDGAWMPGINTGRCPLLPESPTEWLGVPVGNGENNSQVHCCRVEVLPPERPVSPSVNGFSLRTGSGAETGPPGGTEAGQARGLSKCWE